MKCFRENPFQNEKNNTTPSLLEFPSFKTFSIGTNSIQTERYYSRVVEAVPSTITILIVLSRGTLLGNAPFNNILNPLCLVCITKISLPAQFHSISIFLYYSMLAGLTSERGPCYLCAPSGCGRIARYTRRYTRCETETPLLRRNCLRTYHISIPLEISLLKF